MNLAVLQYNKFVNFFDNTQSEYLGFYFSLILHLFILLLAIGIPNFFETKQITIPKVIPIEILNISETTSIPNEIPKEIKKIKPTEKKKTSVEEKKFSSSENQEIKKIDIKDKPEIEKTKVEKQISSKDDIIIKEKKTIPIELEKDKIKTDINNFETLPTKKIKPKIKPKPKDKNLDEKLESDVITKAKPQPKPEPEINFATMLKDLRNEKTTPKIENEEAEKKKETQQEKEITSEAAVVQLSISEIDLVLQQLSKCFIAPAGAKIKQTMFVKISAKIQRNRRVIENSIRIIDTNISKSSSVYGPITESAMRTLLNPECIPLKLPEDKYNIWKNLTMTFDYSVMRGS